MWLLSRHGVLPHEFLACPIPERALIRLFIDQIRRAENAQTDKAAAAARPQRARRR